MMPSPLPLSILRTGKAKQAHGAMARTGTSARNGPVTGAGAGLADCVPHRGRAVGGGRGDGGA